MVDRFDAITNEKLKLRIEFRRVSNNSLYDPTSISKVEILDSDQSTVLQEFTTVGTDIIKESMGMYYVITDETWNVSVKNVYDKWSFIPAPSAMMRNLIQTTYIDDIHAPVEDHRKGFAYGKPETKAYNGFGSIITPDELRYVYAFGQKLAASSTAEMITDTVLQWYIDGAIGLLEKDLSYHIIKKHVLTRQTIGTEEREDLDAEFLTNNLKYIIWSDPYDFNWMDFRKYMRVSLDHFPIRRVSKCIFRDPLGKQLYDFTKWVRLNGNTSGSIEILPTTIEMMAVPFFHADPRYFGFTRRNRYPDAWLIDYEVGFDSAEEFRARCPELIPIIGKLAAIPLLDDFGDGKTSGLASSSVSLSGISESLSTTMSATSIGGESIIDIDGDPTIYEMFINKDKYIGKKIKSVNIESSVVEEKEILDVVEHDTRGKKCYHIYFEDYSSTTITEDHSLFIKNGDGVKEIKGSEINKGTEILFIFDGLRKEIKVEIIKKIERDKMYDLSVKDNENFLGRNGLIYHNSAFFGARIISYYKQLALWWKRNKFKYGNHRALIGGA